MSLNLTAADEIPVEPYYCPGCGRSPDGELHDCVGRLSTGPVPAGCPDCGRPSTRVSVELAGVVGVVVSLGQE